MGKVSNKKVAFIDLGLTDFKVAWDFQEKYFNEIIEIKLANRNRSAHDHRHTPNYLIFCEHPHVYTLGKSGDEKNLLISEEVLADKKATFYRINRGGDITYHGPGQIVGYPILDLDNFFTDIHKYLRLLEEAVILTLQEYDLRAGRIPGLTGVWMDHERRTNPRKICAIGVKTSRWVTMHGFALNVNTNLDYFNHIVPCGIGDKAVTSISAELDEKVDMESVEQRLMKHLATLFEMNLVHADTEKIPQSGTIQKTEKA